MLTEIITQILEPLYQDGFSLKSLNIEDKSVTIKLISRTVEEALNYLANKHELYWNINELKEIEISTIDYMLNKETKKDININNYKQEINGLLSITPEIENIDYANIINVKNARIFYAKNEQTNMNNGDEQYV